MIISLNRSQPKKFADLRGELSILYESEQLSVKRSISKKNVLRGLHLQTGNKPQTKLIRVLRGAIIDFVLDARLGDRRCLYKEIHASDELFLIESHLAHGFLALEETLFEYICIGQYHEPSEEVINIANSVEKSFGVHDLIMSEKDLNYENYDVDFIPST